MFYFSIQLGIIIPTDFHMFQRGRYTTNQLVSTIEFWGYPILTHSHVDEYEFRVQCEAPKIAKLVYNSNKYGLWYL